MPFCDWLTCADLDSLKIYSAINKKSESQIKQIKRLHGNLKLKSNVVICAIHLICYSEKKSESQINKLNDDTDFKDVGIICAIS